MVQPAPLPAGGPASPSTIPPASAVTPRDRSPAPAIARKPAPVRRVLLERLARPLLARFLSTHAAEFCAAHALPLEALAASDPYDRALVHRLYDLLREAPTPAFPEPALALLAELEILAMPRGGELLIALDVAHALPRARLGDEDLALTALLDRHDLALDALAQMPTEAPDAIDGFTEYDPSSAVPFHFGDAERVNLQKLMGAELVKRDRTSHCVVHVTREPDRLILEIEYCRRAKTRDKLDTDRLALAPATDINGERAHAEIEHKTGRLALHAPHAAIKEVLRKAIGVVLAGNDAHFTAGRVYDMAPFRHLASALTPHGDRLLAVQLRRLTLRTEAGSEIDLARPHKDLRQDAPLAPLVDDALAIGAPVAVRLYLTILDRRGPLKVELSAKQGRNRLVFKRTDPEIVAIVRAYLIARGVLKEIAPEAAWDSTATA